MKLPLLFISCCLTVVLGAQPIQLPQAATAPVFSEEMTIDGRLDEAEWERSTPANGFWETFPSDTQRAEYQTEIYFGMDDNYLYMAAKMYVPGDDYVISSLRRDYRAGGNDNITFLFNPFKDRSNAIVFGMNPLGVNREALIYNGGESGRDFREEWDNRWQGESFIGDGFWSCELRIPWSSLRFPDGDTEWFFNSYRFDTQSNTRSTWHHIPQNQMIMSLAYMGSVLFEEAPKQRGSGITLIPYASGGMAKDFEEDTPTDWSSGIGGDAKVAISSGLNLDLTFNPDFSQVEVDRQVINTSRFEIFFPERRQFFLENADLFGNFGDGSANPFFSRRIGVTRDTSTGTTLQNPIYYGARLSGKLNNDWRVGLLNMQTAANFDNGLPSYNYTVAAAQRLIGKRSNLGAIFVNKENFGNFQDTTENNLDHNRVFGLDYNLATNDNVWNGKVYVHGSMGPESSGQGLSHGLTLERRKRNINIRYEHQYVGENFNAEVGFVPRRGFFRPGFGIRLRKYPEGSKVVERSLSLNSQTIFSNDEGLTDQTIRLNYNWNYQNTSGFNLGIRHNYVYLLSDFDPSRSDAEPLPGLQGYNYTNFDAFWGTDRRKRFSVNVRTELGEFFNGYRYGIGGNLTYRYQPYGSINLRVDYSYIDLPAPHASTALFLIGPRIDLTFSKELFLTTFIQYNDQINNINLNARLQWRYAPVSDIYLVYTDNYDSFDLGVKNRALVFKWTYWLNV